eukprot:6175810-Pleurochrysis_carterae.AAC.4
MFTGFRILHRALRLHDTARVTQHSTAQQHSTASCRCKPSRRPGGSRAGPHSYQQNAAHCLLEVAAF